MATIMPLKGGLLEKGSYIVEFGTVNGDGGGAAYSGDSYYLIEILDNLNLQEQVQKVKIGGGLTPRHDYTQFTGTATIRVFLPRGGPLTTDKLGLPIKLTRQTWNDLTVPAIVTEGALESRTESGSNGAGVMEEWVIDFNPHWLVEALD